MRVALAVEYNGDGFCGWQRQPHCLSVQEALEQVLTRIADQEITVICSGRTDTGVHAYAQIVHFDCVADRPERAWTFGANAALSRKIAVHWASVCSDDFHARFNAESRSYRYLIQNCRTRPGLHAGLRSWINETLDVNTMHEAGLALLGTHDFSSFRSADCQAKQPVRTIKELSVRRQGDLVQIDITANGFLHNMVRIIAGSLVRIGKGQQPVGWLGELLSARDRTQAGATLPPGGLYFLQPRYPAECAIPDFTARWQVQEPSGGS